MAQKKLFILQYSWELDKFQLQIVDNPQELQNFDIPIIDARHLSNIALSSYLVDTQKVECSFPDAQVISNPHNKPIPSIKLGYLYNGFAIHHPNFAPEGWHVPTDEEWTQLYSSTEFNAGNLKETGYEFWEYPNIGADNSRNFFARAGGYRYQSGTFYYLNQNAYFWSSTVYTDDWTYYRKLNYNDVTMNRAFTSDIMGHSVRLVKDDNFDPVTFIDLDGNTYDTSIINGKVWLRHNWKCTKLNDGTALQNITENFAWRNTSQPAYCAYNNDLNLV